MTPVLFDSGLQVITQYLTKEIAYFLGGIFAADEAKVSDGVRFWIAPVRYNHGYASQEEIDEHFSSVRQISAQLQVTTTMAENIRGTSLDSGKFRLPGFGTFFRSISLDRLVSAIPKLKDALSRASNEVKQAFMAGVFDGRGSIDINLTNRVIRYISLDCPNDDIGNFFFEFFSNNGLICNYNTARERLEGGAPRRNQFRISNSETYMRKVGFISLKKYNVMNDAFHHKYTSVQQLDFSEILPGLRGIDVR